LSKQHQIELDRHFAWFEARLPPRPARFVGWLRKPSSRYARIPLALLLILGGVFSFLPVLGLWMLPLGLLLFAQDVPMLQKPMARMLGWVERKWIERQRKRPAEKRARKPAMNLFQVSALDFRLYRGAQCDSKANADG
jgi:hypothetical protein